MPPGLCPCLRCGLACLHARTTMVWRACQACWSKQGAAWAGEAQLPAALPALQACSALGMCESGTSTQQCTTCKALLRSTTQAVAGALGSQQGECAG